MMKPLVSALMIALLPLDTAAAEPVDRGQVAALLALQQLDGRVHDVGYRLVTANAPFCRDQIGHDGLLLHRLADYGDQAAARAAFGFVAPYGVAAVAPGSPAEVAGVAVNEAVLTPSGPDSALTVLRDGEPVELTDLTLAAACASRFEVAPDDDFEASADGERVRITSRLVDYIANDDELAALLAHELAHNLLDHRERLNAMQVNRGFFGQFGKSAGRIRATEVEADRLSVWLMANAGYDPGAAIAFWTRYGGQHGKGIFSPSTHYRWQKRVALFEEEMAKIAATPAVDGKRAPPLLVAYMQGK